jgi:hypothetical protein
MIYQINNQGKIKNHTTMSRRILLLFSLSVMLSSCFLSMHTRRKPALVKNVDINETLKISKHEMEKKSGSQGLGIWVLRDQVVTPAQAHTISDLYLSHIDSMKSEFNIWHSSWAIANLYRFGDEAVKTEQETAYQKAKIQPERLKGGTKKLANSHINGKKTVTGFIHAGGRAYAKRHLVVPGNKRYVQSYEEYLKKEKK